MYSRVTKEVHVFLALATETDLVPDLVATVDPPAEVFISPARRTNVPAHTGTVRCTRCGEGRLYTRPPWRRQRALANQLPNLRLAHVPIP